MAASSQTFDLRTEWKAKAENKHYVFKRTNSSSKYGKWHVSRKGETVSMCGNFDRSDQPNRNSGNVSEVDEDSSVEDLEEVFGLGELCGKCSYMWENRRDRDEVNV